MTPDEHKAIVRRFFEEVWNGQRLEVIDEVFAPTAPVADELGLLQQLGSGPA